MLVVTGMSDSSVSTTVEKRDGLPPLAWCFGSGGERKRGSEGV
jgi:hypothetical protein